MASIDLNNLYHALHNLVKQMHRAAHKDYCMKGVIYHGQAKLLAEVSGNDGASQKELAKKLDVRPSSMTEMLSKLENNGFIFRKQDQKDQRVSHIHLTDEGKKIVEHIEKTKDEFEEKFFSALTEEEKEQFFVLIKKLCLGLENDNNNDYKNFHHCREHHHRHFHHTHNYDFDGRDKF
ncbi:MarR family winged helix-turn-helix transcriptional regulator [Clostridium neuense]|uniref:MarR family winged helix-turn-helix transcriptional regulator n=1 Tax=Clostridium neuense TaxID=1728934 RepID=A0ABW8TED4_9CLOT